MKYDFETLVPALNEVSPMRRRLDKMGYSGDSICYGVAEMKFPLFPPMAKAAAGMIERGHLGYSGGYDEYFAAVSGWLKRRHGWDVLPEETLQTFGVVQAIGICIRAYTKPGDGVLIQSPVYNPFAGQVTLNNRKVVENKLYFEEGKYHIDFDDFEKKVADKDTKLFILCSPHNPVGRVWTRHELERMSEVCLRHGVLVISDEIHFDIVYGGVHTVYATISREAEENSIVCTAPSKTFNVPGLLTSNIVIKNKELRDKFKKEMQFCCEFFNPVGVEACRGAYESGDEWVDQMREYIGGNMRLLQDEMAKKLPETVVTKAEGTYLAWLDLSFLGMTDAELASFVKDRAKIAVNPGYIYGSGGSGHIRLNVGCPKRYVTQAVDRLSQAVREL